jgi:WD40 repeat protein
VASGGEELYAPRGILTYTRDGDLFSVVAGDPGQRVEPPADAMGVGSEVREEGVFPSPDGRYMANVRRDETGVWLDVVSGDTVVFTQGLAGPSDPALRGGKELAAAVDGIPLAVAWSPDSAMLAAGSITGAPWALNIISAGSWRVETHAVAGGYVGELAWSPDGQVLAISTYAPGLTDHTVLLFDRGDVTMQRLVRGCTIVWSPDGRYLAVRREPRDVPGLWIVAVDGSVLARVADGEATFPVAWTEG